MVVLGVLLPLFLAPVLAPAAAGPPRSSAVLPAPERSHAPESSNPRTYAVLFEQNGLPGSSWWTVDLNGTSRSTQGADFGIDFSAPNGSYPFGVSDGGYAATPASGTVVIDGNSVVERIIFSVPSVPYQVQFVESGLPPSIAWSVALNGTSQTATGSSISFNQTNGTYSYEVSPIAGYETTYLGSVTVNGSNVSIPVRFQPTTYPLTFVEQGLQPGSRWSVTIGAVTQSTATDAVSWEEPNGSYAYQVGPVPGYAAAYSGSAVVQGGPASALVTFTVVRYALTFQESGLPSSTPWTVTVGGTAAVSNQTTVTVLEPNGSYPVTVGTQAPYEPSPAAFSTTVNGMDKTLGIQFLSKAYLATFIAVGIPNGTTWAVTVDGVTQSGAAPGPLQFDVANGTHNYTIGAEPGFTTSWSGTFVVVGSNISITVPFSLVEYLVAFDASGLPSDIPWNVSLSDGAALSTRGMTATLRAPNGTYGFTTSTPSLAWQTLEERGTVTVNGTNVSVAILFEYAYPVTFLVGSLPSGVTWYVNLTGSLAAVAAPHAPSAAGVTYGFQSTTSSLIFALPNGSYAYTVASNSASWVPPSTNYNLSIVGASPPPQSIQPLTVIGPSSPTAAGAWLTWAVIAVAVVAIVTVAAVGYRTYALRPAPTSGPGAIDELYSSYDLTSEVDPATVDGNPDALDDIF